MNCKVFPLRPGDRIVHAALACLTMLLLWLPLSVNAQTKCTAAASLAAVVPATIYVNPKLLTGQGLTDWIRLSPGSSSMYECKGGNALLGAAVSVAGLSKSGLQTPHWSGRQISVYDTNVPGVGVAFAVSLYVGVCSSGVLDAGGSTSGASGSGAAQFTPSSGCGTAGTTRPLAVSVDMQFVKTGTISGGTVTPRVPMLQSSYSIDGVLTSGSWVVTAGPTVVQGLSTCTAQDVTVAMGSYKSSAFSGVGTTTPAKSFEVSVSCPPGMMLVTTATSPRPMTIGYRINVPGGKVLAVGVAALSSGSTAKGIGLRLSNSTSSPLTFGATYPLEYSATSGSNQSVKFQAAYQQVAATVTPGTANAVLTFAMDYQ